MPNKKWNWKLTSSPNASTAVHHRLILLKVAKKAVKRGGNDGKDFDMIVRKSSKADVNLNTQTSNIVYCRFHKWRMLKSYGWLYLAPVPILQIWQYLNKVPRSNKQQQ